MKKQKRKGSASHDIRGLFETAKAKKPNKYGAKKTTVYGIEFHSGHEASRYILLRALEQQGKIRCLVMQQPYRIAVNGKHITKYISDFEYIENGEYVVEDAKGHRTREYIIKRKLMEAVYGIIIRET